MKFIINADDLGQSHLINTAIKKYAEQRLISSSTILANGPCFDDVKSIAQSCPHISYGVHLNLTEFYSLTKADVFKDKGLTNEKGRFNGISEKGEVTFDEHMKNAIFDEWVVQIETIYEQGINISHIDGHHFIHLKPELYPVLKKIQRKFGIRKVRATSTTPFLSILSKTVNRHKTENMGISNKNTQNKHDSIYSKNLKKAFKRMNKEVYNFKLRHFYKTKTPDLFFSYFQFFNLLEEGFVFSENSVIELMAHPGGDGCDWFHIENRLIERNSIPNLLKKFELISYNEL